MKNIGQLLREGGVFFGITADASVLVKQLRAADGLSFGNDVFKARPSLECGVAAQRRRAGAARRQVEFNEQHAAKLFPASQPFGARARLGRGCRGVN